MFLNEKEELQMQENQPTFVALFIDRIDVLHI